MKFSTHIASILATATSLAAAQPKASKEVFQTGPEYICHPKSEGEFKVTNKDAERALINISGFDLDGAYRAVNSTRGYSYPHNFYPQRMFPITSECERNIEHSGKKLHFKLYPITPDASGGFTRENNDAGRARLVYQELVKGNGRKLILCAIISHRLHDGKTFELCQVPETSKKSSSNYVKIKEDSSSEEEKSKNEPSPKNEEKYADVKDSKGAKDKDGSPTKTSSTKGEKAAESSSSTGAKATESGKKKSGSSSEGKRVEMAFLGLTMTLAVFIVI